MNISDPKKYYDFVHINSLKFDEEDYFINHKEKYLLLKKLIENKKPKSILDIGAGSGIFYSLLDESYAEKVLAIEVVPEFVEVLKKRGINAKVCNVEKEEIPATDNSFDMVICDSILEHTLKPKKLVSKIYRCLKSGGIYVVIIPNATSIMRRWHFLRGRNLFWPLIDNLYTKNYLPRCSIFYSEKELKFILEDSDLIINEVQFINETFHDDKALSVKACRFLSLFNTKFKDVIFLVGKKL